MFYTCPIWLHYVIPLYEIFKSGLLVCRIALRHVTHDLSEFLCGKLSEYNNKRFNIALSKRTPLERRKSREFSAVKIFHTRIFRERATSGAPNLSPFPVSLAPVRPIWGFIWCVCVHGCPADVPKNRPDLNCKNLQKKYTSAGPKKARFRFMGEQIYGRRIIAEAVRCCDWNELKNQYVMRYCFFFVIIVLIQISIYSKKVISQWYNLFFHDFFSLS